MSSDEMSFLMQCAVNLPETEAGKLAQEMIAEQVKLLKQNKGHIDPVPTTRVDARNMAGTRAEA
jgi:hypothetical protein